LQFRERREEGSTRQSAIRSAGSFKLLGRPGVKGFNKDREY
jgi:hypothetical protein